MRMISYQEIRRDCEICYLRERLRDVDLICDRIDLATTGVDDVISF